MTSTRVYYNQIGYDGASMSRHGTTHQERIRMPRLCRRQLRAWLLAKSSADVLPIGFLSGPPQRLRSLPLSGSTKRHIFAYCGECEPHAKQSLGTAHEIRGSLQDSPNDEVGE